MEVKKKEKMQVYPVNYELCVLPSMKERESQFEAFQSILAYMLNANEDSPYTQLLKKHNIPLSLLSKTKEGMEDKDGIYYKRPYRGSTHYIVKKEGKVIDPYDEYQPQGTQGFCQLFSFFIFMGEKGFKKVHVDKKVKKVKKVNVDNFFDYAYNTYLCLQKFLNLIKKDKELNECFDKSFQQLDKKQFGIKPRTTSSRFLRDLAVLDLESVMYYIYDNPLQGWKNGEPKKELWESIPLFKDKISD
jgi:predicted transcriptional regulator